MTCKWRWLEKLSMSSTSCSLPSPSYVLFQDSDKESHFRIHLCNSLRITAWIPHFTSLIHQQFVYFVLTNMDIRFIPSSQGIFKYLAEHFMNGPFFPLAVTGELLVHVVQTVPISICGFFIWELRSHLQ